MENTGVFLSVVVSTHPKGRAPDQTLRSLEEALSHEEDWEILLCVNGVENVAEDGVKDRLRSLASSVRCCRILETEQPGLLASRTIGLLSSSAEVIAFIDDDYLVGNSWGRAVYENFASPGIDLATGCSIPVFEDTPPSWLELFERRPSENLVANYLVSTLLQANCGVEKIDPTLVFGQNLVARRQKLIEIGGFNPDLMPSRLWIYTGDGEFGLTSTMAATGCDAVLDCRMNGKHLIGKSRLTMRGLLSRSKYDAAVSCFNQARNLGRPSPIWRVFRTALVATLRKHPVEGLYYVSFAFYTLLWSLSFSAFPDLRNWVKKSNFLSQWGPNNLKKIPS